MQNEFSRHQTTPIAIIKEEDMRIELSSSQNVKDQETGELIDILIAPKLVVSNKPGEDGKHELPVDPKMFTNERLKLFNNLTYSLGKMVRLAELNLDTLSDVIQLCLQRNTNEEIIARNADCKKLEATLS